MELLEKIISIQRKNPHMLLCGSYALMLADVMDERPMGDIDFVINSKDRPRFSFISNLKIDYNYPEFHKDGYISYHGRYKDLNINLLVFNDDIGLEKETITNSGKTISVQKIDHILNWKKKYNRPKDQKDLENIANKCLEEIIAQ